MNHPLRHPTPSFEKSAPQSSRLRRILVIGGCGLLVAIFGLCFYPEIRPYETIDPDLFIFDGHVHLMASYSADPSKLIREMDEAGIDRALLLGSPVRTAPGIRLPKSYLRTINNTMLGKAFLDILADTVFFQQNVVAQPDNRPVFETVSAYPDRLVGFCWINPNVPTFTKELERCTEQWNLSGIKLHLWLYPIDLEDERIMEVAAFAQAHGLPILIDLGIDPALADFTQVAECYPDVKFIIAHLGGILFEQAIEKAKRVNNVYLDTSGYTVTLSRLQGARDALGASRLIFGSDAPSEVGGDMRDSLDLIARLGLTEEELEAVLSGNLLDVLAASQAWR